MGLLRLRHSTNDGANHAVLIEFDGHAEERRFAFEVTSQDMDGRLQAALFDGSELWPAIQKHLSDTRVEILGPVGMPWESMALDARAVVRGTERAAEETRHPDLGGPLRVLLTDCDAVSRRLFEGLSGNEAVEFTVLRRPAIEELSEILAAEPFHVVHLAEGDATALGALLREAQAGAVVASASMPQALLDAGAPAVVAMPSAEFVAALYQELLRGKTWGEAATSARRRWPVHPLPVVFEAGELALFAASEDAPRMVLGRVGAMEVEGLPPRPATGFIGRDETLRALEDAVARHRVVLLHGDAGIGKTTAAAEFARWYSHSGGIGGPVLFTSFTHPVAIGRLIDQVGQVFAPSLQQAGVPWPALDDGQRRQVALDVLRQVPVLWIWDNLETVTEGQEDLAAFLRDARQAGARFLLTSRSPEHGWLGDVERVVTPPMAAEDAAELAVAAADQYRRRLPDAGHFRPLAEFAKGNPLATVMSAGQAMRDGLRTLPEFRGLAARLAQAEEAAPDESAEGVTPVLAGALNYVWASALDDADRARLAMLHLFQGLLHVDLVRAVANEGDDPAHLLERAALAGLLAGYAGEYYAVQPSLAWFFRRQFEERDAEWRQSAIVSYIDAVGSSAAFYAGNAAKGDRGALDALRADHLNLTQARLLARHFGRWGSLIGATQGLKPLYQLAGRTGEWRALVKETAPDFVNAETDGPISGREEGWNTLTGFLIEFAQEDRAWAVAEGLQQLRVDWLRGRTEDKDTDGRRALAIALGTLGQIQREAGSSECVTSMREAFDIVNGLGDRVLTAIGAFDLGRTFEITREWDQAEEWYGRSLQVCPEDDRAVRPKILSQLGGIAYERFLASVRDGAPNVAHLENTARLYHEALELTPPDALPHLAVIHNQLGNTYYQAGETDRALEHYQQSIECKESSGNSYAAATTRYNVALLLLDAKRYIEALDYSRAALRELETHGPRAAKEVQTITELITEIQKAAFA